MSLKHSHTQIKETEKRYKEQQEFLQCLKSVLKCSKKYSDSAAELANSGNEFARELTALSKKECISPYEKMVQFLFDYSTVMTQLGSVCNQMLDQMQTEFYNALTQFIDHGFNEAHAYKSKMEEAQANYDNALSRIDELTSKKGKLDESKMISMEEELNNLKSTVVATTDEFQSSMEHLDANKEFKFLRCMYQHAELQTTYFLVGHKLYANLMGKIDPVKKHLEHLDSVSPYKNIFEGNLMKKGKNLGGWKKYLNTLSH